MLTKAVESYIALRRATGRVYEYGGRILLQFARFASDFGDSFVRAETAIQWAGAASSPAGRNCRLREVARFARFAHAEEPRHEVPQTDRFAQPYCRRVPFIFSPDDIRRLLAQAWLLEPKESLLPLTYVTLLSLLASTGMRIGEALRLRQKDFAHDELIIRNTKFKKSRLVPLHPTAVAGLDRYLEQRLSRHCEHDHIFIDHREGKNLRYKAVYLVFRRLVDAVGLRRSEGPSPRLHSFRHTFAVRALEGCPSQRDAVGRHMVALSTYLGHVSFRETYWYLEATPHLLKDISDACAAFRNEAAQ